MLNEDDRLLDHGRCSLCQQKSRKICAILSGHAGNQCNFPIHFSLLAGLPRVVGERLSTLDTVQRAWPQALHIQSRRRQRMVKREDRESASSSAKGPSIPRRPSQDTISVPSAAPAIAPSSPIKARLQQKQSADLPAPDTQRQHGAIHGCARSPIRASCLQFQSRPEKTA